MDSFLIQGPKVLIRVGLVVFNHFAEYNQSRGLYVYLMYTGMKMHVHITAVH